MSAQELYEVICNYCYDIIEGKINACKKHKLACKRFLDDIDKQDNENFKYYFDANELYKFNEWAKLFKHRTGIVKDQQINLVPWQLFIAGNLFGWKNKVTNYRRFRKAFISVGRKNAKSELLSLIATYECFITNENSEIYITGWNREGSNIVYREIQYHLTHPFVNPEFFEGKYKDSYGQITHVKSGSFIKPLSRDNKNTDNANNPSLAIVDEYKDHVTSEIYDNLESGMVRPNALIVIISTAGSNLNSPMMTEYNYVSKIIDPDIDIVNDEYFIMICELEKREEIFDKSNWIKANPIVATSDYGMDVILKSKYQAAIDAPEKMRTFLTKNMNMWVDMRENGYMDMEKWRKCEANFTFEDFKNMDCIVGGDLAKKIDLTSICFEFYKDGLYYFIHHSWIPRERYDIVMKEGKYRYDLWVDAGYLTLCEGANVDYEEILDFMEEVKFKYNIKIKEFCYDPWNSSQFVNYIEKHYGYRCVEVRQGPQTLNEPTQDIRDLTYACKLRHPTDDGLMNFAMSNCIATQHKQEWIMLDKEKSKEKIDPIAAMVDAHCRAMKVLKNSTKSIFYVPNRKR